MPEAILWPHIVKTYLTKEVYDMGRKGKVSDIVLTEIPDYLCYW
jgi:hypothetical protein